MLSIHPLHSARVQFALVRAAVGVLPGFEIERFVMPFGYNIICCQHMSWQPGATSLALPTVSNVCVRRPCRLQSRARYASRTQSILAGAVIIAPLYKGPCCSPGRRGNTLQAEAAGSSSGSGSASEDDSDVGKHTAEDDGSP